MIKSKWKNAGFSLVQVLISVGLTGALAMLASHYMSKTGTSIQREKMIQDVEMWIDGVFRELSQKDVCEDNYKGEDFSQPHDRLLIVKKLPNNEIYTLVEKNKKYLGDKILVEKITATKISINQLQVELEIRKINQSNPNDFLKRRLILPVHFDPLNKLLECVQVTNYAAIDASSACVGSGQTTISGECIFHGWPNTAITNGQGVNKVEFNQVTYNYDWTPQAIFTKPSAASCSHGKMMKISEDGIIECLTSGNIIHNQPAVFNNGSSCKLTAYAGKVGVYCSSGGGGCSSNGTVVQQNYGAAGAYINGVCVERIEGIISYSSCCSGWAQESYECQPGIGIYKLTCVDNGGANGGSSGGASGGSSGGASGGSSGGYIPPNCIPDGQVCHPTPTKHCGLCCSGFPISGPDNDCSHGGECGGQCRPNL